MGNKQSNPELPPQGPEIFLNVYVPANKEQMQMPGFGVYHSGIEINGVEYAYAGGSVSGSGVMTQIPKSDPPGSNWTYKQTENLGQTRLTNAEVARVISDIKLDFPADGYDLVSRNCNHFSEVLCLRLGLKFPAWVNRAAKWGASMRGGGDVVAEEKKKLELIKKKQEEERKTKAELDARQSKLPQEPAPDAPGICTIQINCPNGKKTKRRFLWESDTIGDVMAFASAFDVSLGKNFCLRINRPIQRFTDKKATIKGAGLGTRENLFIEVL